MPRNKSFINQEKRWKIAMREMVPKIYSAFILSLHRRFNFSFEDIVTVISDTQEYWRLDTEGEMDICRVCSEETGIDMLSEESAKKAGIEGDAIV